MAKYKVDRIIEEDIDGIMSRVKYISTSTQNSFTEWLMLLKENDYTVIRFNKEYCLLNERFDKTDVVKLKCNIPIQLSWIKNVFPDFFKIYM